MMTEGIDINRIKMDASDNDRDLTKVKYCKK